MDKLRNRAVRTVLAVASLMLALVYTQATAATTYNQAVHGAGIAHAELKLFDGMQQGHAHAFEHAHDHDHEPDHDHGQADADTPAVDGDAEAPHHPSPAHHHADAPAAAQTASVEIGVAVIHPGHVTHPVATESARDGLGARQLERPPRASKLPA